MAETGPGLQQLEKPKNYLEAGLTNDIYAMYMRWIPITSIARELGLDDKYLHKIIKNKGWKAEREALQKDIKKAVKQQAMQRLNSITANGLMIVDVCLKSTLRAYKENKRLPSVNEAETIMKMVKVAHFIKTFEEGAGSGEQMFTMNPEEVLEAFRQDPYMRKVIAKDNIEVLPPVENGTTNEDTFDRRNSERSASQEARALAAGTE